MIFPDSSLAIESTENQLIARRGVLGTLGLAGLGALLSSATAGAVTSQKRGSAPNISVPTSAGSASPAAAAPAALADLPEEWLQRHGALVPAYLRYLNGLKMQRVCAQQVIESHAKAKGSVWNALPPKVWWNRMGYTLRVVDRIAREMNVSKVEVVSAYRCPVYNATCAGAKSGSWHQANVAVDVKFPTRASQVTRTARELRDLGLFKGGVGGYWDFTHIDCRGVNINW